MSKKFFYPASLVLILTVVMTILMTIVFHTGMAMAQSQEVVGSDPASSFLQLYQFIRSGKGTMAMGAGGVIVVWVIRSILSKTHSWFATKAGGYVIGITTATIEYVSVALLAEQAITVLLFVNAIGAAFVASGGWEAVRDIINKTKNTEIIAKAAVVGLVVTLAACAGTGGAPRRIGGQIFVDCLAADRQAINDLVDEFAPLITEGRADWSVIYSRAKSAGLSVGGCFLAEIVGVVTGSSRSLMATTTESSKTTARAYLELFRSEQTDQDVIFKTKAGEY